VRLRAIGEGFAGEDIWSGRRLSVPPKSRHGARNGDKAAKLTITYVVDKDKPLALPAQE
jgi:hypothetical protein